MAEPVERRSKEMSGHQATATDYAKESMDSVWVIRWENITYPFASRAAAKASICMTYPDCLVVEANSREGETVYEVALDGRVQDRVTVIEYRMISSPVQLPGRRVASAEF